MKFRKLGQSDLNCSVIGLGTWGMAGSFWGKVDDDQSIATIRAGLEAGINLIDTAPVYGDGHSEEVVGRALEGLKREDIVLATKCGRFTCETEKIRQEMCIRDRSCPLPLHTAFPLMRRRWMGL